MVAWAKRRDNGFPDDQRQRMIAETSAFLTWALADERNLPRIPRRRADQGGWSAVLNRPMAKVVVNHFWGRALSVLDRAGQ